MKDYVAEFQGRLAEIDADSQSVNIINAGIMNHGKSSLLNSLIDAEIFEVQDIRQTVENKTECWFDDVYLTDTPGLAAEEIDDAAAYAAYRRANFILFVHKTEVGELHKNEIDAINKIKSFFNDDNFFWQHFSLVLTSLDAYAKDTASLDAIREKSLTDILTNCGGAGFPVFIVSNTRYQKGVAENKPKLVELSGIPELKSYLQENIPAWRTENADIRAMRITSEKDNFIEMLGVERKNIQDTIDRKTADLERRQQNFLSEVEDAVSQYNSDKRFYNNRYWSMDDDLDNLERDLNDEENDLDVLESEFQVLKSELQEIRDELEEGRARYN